MRYSTVLQRVLAVIAACITWAYAGAFFFVGYLVSVMQCDEACDGERGWRSTPGAWQWDVFFAIGLAVFVAGCAFVYFIWKGRRARAAVALMLGVAAALALAIALDPDGWWSSWVDWSRPRQVRYALLGFCAPIAALALTRPKRVETSGP
jgi:hypothetical protein